MRLSLAFLLAPPVAVLTYFVGFATWYALASGAPNWAETLQMAAVFSFYGLPIVYGLALIIGVPTYFALIRLGLRGPATGVVSAFLIGSLFILIPELIRVVTALDGSSMSVGNGRCDIIVDNVRTLCGYGHFAIEIAAFGSAGAASGLVFWLISRPDKSGNGGEMSPQSPHV